MVLMTPKIVWHTSSNSCHLGGIIYIPLPFLFGSVSEMEERYTCMKYFPLSMLTHTRLRLAYPDFSMHKNEYLSYILYV